MTDFFTSDSHFFHDNIIGYCNRPFSSVAEMDEEMIRRWNERVTPEDTVYHLGDFCFGPFGNISLIRARLNGKIILIRGNHDRGLLRMITSGMDGAYESFYTRVRPPDPPGYVYLRHKPNLGIGFALWFRTQTPKNEGNNVQMAARTRWDE